VIPCVELQGVRDGQTEEAARHDHSVDPELWERIEQLARADRRPVASYLKIVIADAIGAQSSREAAAA
jgi:hypothetical protein